MTGTTESPLSSSRSVWFAAAQLGSAPKLCVQNSNGRHGEDNGPRELKTGKHTVENVTLYLYLGLRKPSLALALALVAIEGPSPRVSIFLIP